MLSWRGGFLLPVAPGMEVHLEDETPKVAARTVTDSKCLRFAGRHLSLQHHFEAATSRPNTA